MTRSPSATSSMRSWPARSSAGACPWPSWPLAGPPWWGSDWLAETAPMALDEGVLTVGVSNGPWGAQARFLQEEIRRNADEALGGGRVTAIRIIVRNRS